MSKSSWN